MSAHSNPSDDYRPSFLTTNPNTLNILVLGQTGVGKSTWINGIANYLRYSTLEDAEDAEFICKIPMSFEIYDKNYMQHQISTGAVTSNSEKQDIGVSCTQRPNTYEFPVGDVIVRLIDTPGIGDTRGIEQDKLNFKLIMNHIACFDKLHGICILMKPNESRINETFKFCILELLTNLHSSAIHNIVICFTNCQGTHYKPGQTLSCLRILFETNKVNITLDKDTMYCLDNEPMRYLAAVKFGTGYEIDKRERRSYVRSWEESQEESQRLIDYLKAIEPHMVKDTLSINNARRGIEYLIEPIAFIVSNIQTNISALKKQKLLWSRKGFWSRLFDNNATASTKPSNDDIIEMLRIPFVDVKINHLENPREVCKMCVSERTDGDVTRRTYEHDCELVNYTFKENVNSWWYGKCKQCNHPWREHTEIHYDIEKISTKVDGMEQDIKLSTEEDLIATVDQMLTTLKARKLEFKEELKHITNVSAVFSCFLMRNAIVEFNDSMFQCLDLQIDVEKKKRDRDKRVIEGLEAMKSNYQKAFDTLQKNKPDNSHNTIIIELLDSVLPGCLQRQIKEEQWKKDCNSSVVEELVKLNAKCKEISDEIKSNQTDTSISPEVIKLLIELLYRLKHTGPMLRIVIGRAVSMDANVTPQSTHEK